MAVNLKHPVSGIIKECPEGFSWTVFFFGGLVPLFRSMWGAFFITLFTGGLASFYYMFKLNKIQVAELLEKGFSPAGDIDRDKIKAMGISLSGSHDVHQEKKVIAA